MQIGSMKTSDCLSSGKLVADVSGSKLVRNTCIALGALMLTGCANLRPAGEQSRQPEAQRNLAAQTLPNGSIRFDTTDERIAQMWAEAEEARIASNYDLALQHLFRALEVSPQNSLIWSRAAEVQLDNAQAALAENFAVKSNSFAGNNASLLHRNWLIIEHARSMRGDLLGVRSAHKKVQEYQYR